MQQTSIKKNVRLGGKGDRLGIVQDIQTWLYKQMVYVQTLLGNGTNKILRDFEVQAVI